MAARFASNLAILLIGAFLTCVSFAFGPFVAGWLALGFAALAALIVLVAFALPERGVAQRVFDACVLPLAAWTIVASRTFSGSTETWLCFASGATFALLACVGLVVHEVLLELALGRRRHQLVDGRVLDTTERPPLGAVG
jgi:hypothetical protein